MKLSCALAFLLPVAALANPLPASKSISDAESIGLLMVVTNRSYSETRTLLELDGAYEGETNSIHGSGVEVE